MQLQFIWSWSFFIFKGIWGPKQVCGAPESITQVYLTFTDNVISPLNLHLHLHLQNGDTHIHPQQEITHRKLFAQCLAQNKCLITVAYL